METEDRMRAALDLIRLNSPSVDLYIGTMEAVEASDRDHDGINDPNENVYAGDKPGITAIVAWDWPNETRLWGRTEFEFEADSIEQIADKLMALYRERPTIPLVEGGA